MSWKNQEGGLRSWRRSPFRCATVIGFLTTSVCASLENLYDWMRIDDGLEVFKLHNTGGICIFIKGSKGSVALNRINMLLMNSGYLEAAREYCMIKRHNSPSVAMKATLSRRQLNATKLQLSLPFFVLRQLNI